MIKVNNLYKSFDGRTILSDINTVFETGKVNLIIGKSGSGKTVLIKSLIGLHGVDSGEILYEDIDITKIGKKAMKALRQEIGIVFQGGALFDSQTVFQNVLFPLLVFSKTTMEEKIARVRLCLDRVELKGVDDLYPSEISGGMKKRVAIARAIVMQPKFLFCDEPNSGLDPLTSLVIDNLIQEITSEYGMTTIVNTHDMNSVFEIGEKVIFINDGKNEWEGSKDDIMDSKCEALNNFLFSSDILKKLKHNAII